VKVVRGASLKASASAAGALTRATAFDFTGSGGRQSWVGTAAYRPGAATGAHHHGRHEVGVYVVRGRGEIRWGEHLEFAAEIGPGDFIYFAPFVPHQERNIDASEALEFVVVRSDNERIAVDLDIAPAERPEPVF
jgi:uncharacterized RmlC-like cupin family protein